jgi:D-glycero-alpha-D-manno-heptose-7-phosphate kinase
MTTERYASSAPTRIDLAGGTVDLWPLYLFLNRPVTINLGIDLFAEATLEIDSAKPDQVRLVSEDQSTEKVLTVAEVRDPENLFVEKIPPGLILHYKLMRLFFEKKKPSSGKFGEVTLKTRAKSPAGAGLGGSSTLSIAIIAALHSWLKGRPLDADADGESLIEITRDVESTVIQGPAGVQDYYGAMFGGLQALHWRPGSHERARFPVETGKELEKRILLFYSGQSRNSGINNWVLYKSFIDQEAGTRKKFQAINEATQNLGKALTERDWKKTGEAIRAEWATRKKLAQGITTPEIDKAFGKAGELFPEISGKVCGAGGGGCFFVYLPYDLTELDAKKAKIATLFSEAGMRALPFQAVPHGVTVQVTRA